MKETRTCKECGKDFIPCHLTSEFCSKSHVQPLGEIRKS